MNINRELAKQLASLPKEDLQNLLALHGAGTFKRQTVVVAKFWLARNWFRVLPYAAFTVISLAIGIPIILAVVHAINWAFTS